jgi:hypothetical protein
LISRQKLTCFSGDLLHSFEAAPAKKLEIHWEGAPIPLTMWRGVVSFMKWSYDTHKCESQVRLSYNPTLKLWRWAPFPQYIYTSLFTQEIENDPDRETAFAELGTNAGFFEAGTVHHHCSASAFQSGTDHKDELERPGFHVTLGFLQKPTADFHCRASFKKIMYDEPDLKEWLPYTSEEVCSLENLSAFPEVFKERLKKRTYKYNTQGNNVWDDYDYCDDGWGWINGHHKQRTNKGKGKSRKTHRGNTVARYSDKADKYQLPYRSSNTVRNPNAFQVRQTYWEFMGAVYQLPTYTELLRSTNLTVGSDGWNLRCDAASFFTNLVHAEPPTWDAVARRKILLRLFQLGVLRLGLEVGASKPDQRFVWRVSRTPKGTLHKVDIRAVLAEAKTRPSNFISPIPDATMAKIRLGESCSVEEQSTETKKAPAATEGKSPSIPIDPDEVKSFESESLSATISALVGVPDKRDDGAFSTLLLNLFQGDGFFSDWVKDRVAFAAEFGAESTPPVFPKDSMVSIDEVLDPLITQLATICVTAVKATCWTRHYLEKKNTDALRDVFDCGPEVLDDLMETLSGYLTSLSLQEIEEVASDPKKLGIDGQKRLVAWLAEHIKFCVIKERNDRII